MKALELEQINANSQWCRVLLDALADAGVELVIIVPGGRSATLAFNLNLHEDLRPVNHVDERSGAFMALGASIVSGKPVAICTTSGSAVANVLPALTEAYARKLPLIVVSADRPRKIRHLNPPQSTDHLGLTSAVTMAQLDLKDPDCSPDCLAKLRIDILKAVQLTTQDGTAGPIHINVPQNGWLCSTEVSEEWKPTIMASEIRIPIDIPFEKQTNPLLPSEVVRKLKASPGKRGLIVVGDDTLFSKETLTRLATKTAFPMLLDSLAPGRCPSSSQALSTGDVLVLNPLLAPEKVELLIRIGSAPVASTVQDYLRRTDCPSLCLTHTSITPDFMSPNGLYVEKVGEDWLEELEQILGTGDKQWQQQWHMADLMATIERENALAAMPWGEVKAAAIVINTPQFSFIHAANSMAIRYVNLLLRPDERTKTVYAQRGMNGIDGTLGIFFGELLTRRDRGLLLIGDLALVHDLPALSNPVIHELQGTICVINNHGGGIFNLLPCHRLSNYHSTIKNAPRVDFSSIAKSFSLYYKSVASEDELEKFLESPTTHKGLQLIEVKVPNERLAIDFKMLYESMLGINIE